MVYAYVRVSTGKQSTETQRFEIKKFSKTKKIHIDRWIDETISGMKGIQNRRLGKVLRQARKGDVLITSELSRLGRNLMQVQGAGGSIGKHCVCSLMIGWIMFQRSLCE